MVDQQEELVAGADAQMRRMRQRVVHALADAHESLMNSPAQHRASISGTLRQSISDAVSDRGVRIAANFYDTVAELSGGEDVQNEMTARAAHVRAFTEAMGHGVDDGRPWLAAMSVTSAEVVRPDELSELRGTGSWKLMQLASLEATISCMPPDPRGWAAANGEGVKRLDAHDADIAAWTKLDQPVMGERADSDPVVTGHLLRDAIGTRIKDSVQRTDTDEFAMEEVYSKDQFSEAHQTKLVSLGVPEGGDLEDEQFVEEELEYPAELTSDWWALRNGIPAVIDDFPAPNESLQQCPDVRVDLPRQVWDSTRGSLGPAFDRAVTVHGDQVSVIVGAQQGRELVDRAETEQWTRVHNAEERIDQLQEQDDFGLNGEEQEVSQLLESSDRDAYEFGVVVVALNDATPVTTPPSVSPPSPVDPLHQSPMAPSAAVSADLER